MVSISVTGQLHAEFRTITEYRKYSNITIIECHKYSEQLSNITSTRNNYRISQVLGTIIEYHTYSQQLSNITRKAGTTEICWYSRQRTVEDPEYPRKVEVPTYNLAHFPENCMKVKENGSGSTRPCVPLPKSVTGDRQTDQPLVWVICAFPL